jgi:hypothetical protein
MGKPPQFDISFVKFPMYNMQERLLFLPSVGVYKMYTYLVHIYFADAYCVPVFFFLAITVQTWVSSILFKADSML